MKAAGTELTPEFEEALFDGAREKIVFGGWRAGKSRLGASEIAIDASIKLAEGRGALYWLLGPEYPQTEQEFNYLREWFTTWGLLAPKDAVSAPIEGPRHLQLIGGIRIETKSAQYMERLGGVAPDKIVCCEAGQLSDEARLWVRGRVMEKRGRVVYTGTLEDETAHRQWAWYIDLGTAWMQERTDEHAAYSLPSWANRVIYPGGRDDPEILDFERDLREHTGSDFAFLRRIAGEPAGSPYQVYPELDDLGPDVLMPKAGVPAGTKFVRHAGGIDYGSVHPSAQVVVGVAENNTLWVRECAFNKDDPGNTDWMRETHNRLRRVWNAWLWGADPNEKFLARSYDAEAVSGSAGSRDARIGLVRARLTSGRLYFDINGPGVRELYEEMRRVHKKKMRSGEIVLDRIDDDRTAALEDAIEMIDGMKKKELPSSMPARTYKRPTRREYGRVRI